MNDQAAQQVPRLPKKPDYTNTRALLARAAEFETRMQVIEYRQAVTAWLLAEFLHNWRASIAAAYRIQLER